MGVHGLSSSVREITMAVAVSCSTVTTYVVLYSCFGPDVHADGFLMSNLAAELMSSFSSLSDCIVVGVIGWNISIVRSFHTVIRGTTHLCV